ncbi:MAG: BufA2 family periplasmic bufferin-type metallophore [Arenimonas sp.]
MNAQALPMISGASLALLAAGLASTMATSPVQAAGSSKVTLQHCAGVNSCKGHNDCKTATNACKGQGSCKGQGFVAASPAACASMGGNIVDKKVSFKVAASSQIHCVGANVCKGHNDCKTATNACKGQGSCKGQGFIALPAASCSNVGGTAG